MASTYHPTSVGWADVKPKPLALLGHPDIARDALRAALAKIQNPAHHCKGAFARRRGHTVDPRDPTADSWDAIGATMAVARGGHALTIADQLPIFTEAP